MTKHIPSGKNLLLCIFLLLYIAIGLSSCATKKRGKYHKQKKYNTETVQQEHTATIDSVETKKQYEIWRKQKIKELDSLVYAEFGDKYLYTQSDTSLSVYIAAEQIFRPHSSTPLDSTLELLQAGEKILRSNPFITCLIAGHDTSDPNEAYNIHLSAKRAHNLFTTWKQSEEKQQNLPIIKTQVKTFGYGGKYLSKYRDNDPNLPEALIEFRFIPVR